MEISKKFSDLKFGDVFTYRAKGEISSVFVKLQNNQARCELSDYKTFMVGEKHRFRPQTKVLLEASEMSPEALKIHAAKNIDKLIDCIQKAAKSLIPGMITKIQKDTFYGLPSFGINEGFNTIVPIVVRKKIKGNIIACAGWQYRIKYKTFASHNMEVLTKFVINEMFAQKTHAYFKKLKKQRTPNRQ